VGRLLWVELLKLKRTPMIWVGFAGAALAPVLNALIGLGAHNSNLGTAMSWHDHLQQSLVFFAILTGIGLSGLITTFMFGREFASSGCSCTCLPR